MRRWVVVMGALLMFTGCKVRLELDTQIEADGSGRISLAVGFDERFREFLKNPFGGAFGPPPEGGIDPLRDMERDVPAGWTSERFRDGDIEGLRITRAFSRIEELEQVVREGESVGEGVRAPGGTVPDRPRQVSFADGLSVSRERDTFTFRLDPEASGLTRDFFSPPTLPEGTGITFGEEAPLQGEVVVRVTLPGKILEHNADERDGNTLTWRRTGREEPTPLVARSDVSETEGGDLPVVPVVVVVAALLLSGAGLVFRARRPAPAPPVD